VTEQKDKLTTLEAGLLEQILTLHPDRLTTEELVLMMERSKRIAILDALAGLRRSGLARQQGDLVEPTYAGNSSKASLGPLRRARPPGRCAGPSARVPAGASHE
jgi:hypothetical protein